MKRTNLVLSEDAGYDDIALVDEGPSDGNAQRQHAERPKTTATEQEEIQSFLEESFDLSALQKENSTLQFQSVREVSSLLRSPVLNLMLDRFADYEKLGTKNAIPKDDPEYQFLRDCSSLALKIESEKTKVFKFLREHYGVRFPELVLFVNNDAALYGKLVRLLGNEIDNLESLVPELLTLVPSQLVAVIIACASTTNGRALSLNAELPAVREAAEELETLESSKQLFLEYIQTRMPLVCPNLSAFLGTGIASQMFGLATSVRAIAELDPDDLRRLGATRSNAESGIDIQTTGFLSNCDLVTNLPSEIRQKGLRLIASHIVSLARIDDNRRASDDSEGRKARDDVKKRMEQWLEPKTIRGASNLTYQRRTRKRVRPERSGLTQ